MRHRSLERCATGLSSVRKTRHCTLVFWPARLRSELSAEAQGLRADVRRRRALPWALVWQLPTRCSRLSQACRCRLCLGSCRPPAAGRTHAAWHQAVLSPCDKRWPKWWGYSKARVFSGRSPRASDRLTPTQTCSPETRMDGQARHDTLTALPSQTSPSTADSTSTDADDVHTGRS